MKSHSKHVNKSNNLSSLVQCKIEVFALYYFTSAIQIVLKGIVIVGLKKGMAEKMV